MKRNYLYIVIALIFMILQPVLFPSKPYMWNSENLLNEIFKNIFSNFLILLFFFFNYIFLIPRIFLLKNYFLYGLSVFFGLAIIILAPELIFWGNEKIPHQIHQPKQETNLFQKTIIFFSEVDHVVFIFLCTVFFTLFWYEKILNKKNEIEKLKAELSHIKLQIHPHFLFNTLNSLYSSAIKKQDDTPEMILSFSNFLRYLLQDSYQEKVRLEKEIDYIRNYISLQKNRLKNSLEINFDTFGDFKHLKIAPLILYHFIENAFKYGVNPDENSRIDIKIENKDNYLYLLVYNKKVKFQNLESTNIGMQNTKERLNYYYPNRYVLEINETENHYQVNLKINLL